MANKKEKKEEKKASAGHKGHKGHVKKAAGKKVGGGKSMIKA